MSTFQNENFKKGFQIGIQKLKYEKGEFPF